MALLTASDARFIANNNKDRAEVTYILSVIETAAMEGKDEIVTTTAHVSYVERNKLIELGFSVEIQGPNNRSWLVISW